MIKNVMNWIFFFGSGCMGSGVIGPSCVGRVVLFGLHCSGVIGRCVTGSGCIGPGVIELGCIGQVIHPHQFFGFEAHSL